MNGEVSRRSIPNARRPERACDARTASAFWLLAVLGFEVQTGYVDAAASEQRDGAGLAEPTP